jgi:hypothetical protein
MRCRLRRAADLLLLLTLLSTACAGAPAPLADGGAPDGGVDAGQDAGEPDAGALWPSVANHDGGVIAQPNLVLITYADGDAGALGQWAVWITDGGFLSRVAGQYGVHDGTTQQVVLSNSASAPVWSSSADQNIFGPYLAGLLDAGSIPPNTPNTIYALELPYSWPSRAAYCQSEHSFHSLYGTLVYLLVADCGRELAQVEVATSHELVEAATDPFAHSWQITDPNNPWTYLGGEVGDLCSSFSATYREGPWSAQFVWSNDAAGRGEIPCQPWPAGRDYVSLVSPLSMAVAAAGSSVAVPITSWTTASSGTWTLYVTEPGYQTDFLTQPELSASTLSAGGSATVTLHVPSTAKHGQHGAAWVALYDGFSGEVFGSTMVGVTVE